jgi:3-hydroxyisobutyrate dehydrogenase-like beta-hydroxyacid dehydrogenase
MKANDAMKQNRRGFLQVAGAAAATFALGDLPFAAGAAGDATGKMKIENVGLMSPGDMGQAVAMQIKAKGLNVYTALEHRSERTRALSREAGLTDVGTIARLVAECDVVLSIMDPGAALTFAREAADALRATGSHALIVDCNAVAPDTVREIAGVIEGAGGRFLDAGIIGPPPRGKAKANLYASGPGAADLEQLAGPQLVVHVISERIADAHALKMCYAALNKGTQALWLEVLIAAQRLGVDGLLEQQVRQSRADHYDWALRQFPILPPKAYRWVPEMIEISKTLGAAGITSKVFEGAADIYRFVAGTALGKETPENRDKARDGKDVVRLLAQARSRS